MDGMLTQDEINALLNGMDLSGNSNDASNDEPAADQAATDQPAAAAATASPAEASEDALTDIERDAIGEIANISMGSSATTLYSLVNHKVNITTPVVTMATWILSLALTRDRVFLLKLNIHRAWMAPTLWCLRNMM